MKDFEEKTMVDINVSVTIPSEKMIGELEDELISLGWTPPKEKIKIIDLSICIASGIDMEFADYSVWRVHKLKRLYPNTCTPYDSGSKWRMCRVRQDHWYAWDGGECPLPEGLRIEIRVLREHGGFYATTCYPHTIWKNVIAFKVLGPAKGWKYGWEDED